MTAFYEALTFTRQQLDAGEILRFDVDSRSGGYRSIHVETDQGWTCWFDEYEHENPEWDAPDY